MGFLKDLEERHERRKAERKRSVEPSPTLLRDFTGIFVCAMIVFASIAMGFVQVAVKVIFAQDVTFDASWSANLSAMASMALGALIQQKTNALGGGGANISAGGNVNVPIDPTYQTTITPQTDQGVCPCCGQALLPGMVATIPDKPEAEDETAPVVGDPAPRAPYPSGGRL